MNDDILKSKIKLIADNLEKLRAILPKNFEDFQKNDLVIAASERYFQVIVDAIIDCNQILIEKNNLPASDTYFNTFSTLSKISIFPSDLLENLSYCVGARNALVHKYEHIQLKREFKDIKKYLPLFKQYLKIISGKILS
jgi:uncharacterized protein YutE (UPF0331/DUF86 family)